MNRVRFAVLALGLAFSPPAHAVSVVFDFDGGPLHGPTPFSQVAGGITATFTATGQGFSIQEANVLGFTPVGFSGYVLYPNSVFASDLTIAFSQPLTDLSLLYAPEEYATDSSATMRVTAYFQGAFVGTSTATTTPGTWPTGTLGFSSAQGFDSVVVHYDSPPPTGGDYGPIFMVDNVAVSGVPEPSAIPAVALGTLLLGLIWRQRSLGTPCESLARRRVSRSRRDRTAGPRGPRRAG